MPPIQDTVAWVALLSTLSGWLYSYFKAQNSDETRIAALELKIAELTVKVETLWDFLIRRAASEAIQKGFGTMNSPIKLNAQSQSWFDGMKDEIRSWYQTNGLQLSDRDLMMSLERYFGDRMLTEVCIPNGLSAGSCLLVAAAVAKGLDTPIELP